MREPHRATNTAWWNNYLVALAGLLLAGGIAFAAVTAAQAGAYWLAIALGVLAVPFALPTVVQIVGEVVVYLTLIGLVLLLPVLIVSPASREWGKQRWRSLT
ncbi:MULTISPECIES: hypothetical protein [Nocardia]|uniref:Uncharacterized protein n=1 Tax=Nocardia sputorum TaxID=2984338 RepID=A0ABM8CRZ7_9NOCA|nr:hypothetical protein [Nocardia sputorum]BDT97738.1 hypothetical protein IFM12276_07670 [Nocardia sputorum]